MSVGYHREKYTPEWTISDRQVDIIRLLATGYSKDEIAAELHLAPRTVKSYCDILRLKLNCANQREIPLAFMCRTGIDPYPRPEAVA